jgi:hypothetical protein
MATQTPTGAGTDWKKMKVQELREELTSRGLDSSGLKSTLVERLETATAAEIVDKATNPAEGAGRKDMDLDMNVGAPVDEVDEKKIGNEPITTEPPVVAEVIAAKAVPVTDNVPTVDEAVESKSAAPVEVPTPVTNGTAVAALPTDLEKKQRRAERFGIELSVSEGDKRKLRAAR